MLTLLVAAWSLSLFPGSLQEEAAPVRASGSVRAWEHERSDIPPNERLRFGALENGLRWVWAKNSEPKFRSYLRLHVDVGSLAETDDERGLAHFLEHMAFNGSEHFEPGTLVEWFQRHGMEFGADLNAHTGFSETVYQLDLPDSDEGTLDEGLVVLRDFAFGLTLSEEEIEAEKGVIDGEERERDSPGWRVFLAQLEALFGETRLADRLPIGVSAVRAEFDAASVRAFYERWYRPENMTVVLVGDLGKLDPVALFERHFGDVPAPPTSVPVEPSRGRSTDFEHVYAIHEEEIPSVTVLIERLAPWKEERFDRRAIQADIPLTWACRMLNLRFAELAKQEGAPFIGATASEDKQLEIYEGLSLSITSVPERWPQALAFCERELRRALAFGYQDVELETVKKSAANLLDEAVEREQTRHSAALLNDVLRACEDPVVPATAATRREVVLAGMKDVTVDDCRDALRAAWKEGELTLALIGNFEPREGAEEELARVYAASLATEVERGAEVVVKAFAYAAGEEAGAIVARSKVEDLDFETVTFANGVRVNVKATDFKEREILVELELAEGRLTLAKEDMELAWLSDRVFGSAALEAHDSDELRRLSAGRDVGFSFGVSPQTFDLQGRTTREDLLFQCELLCAYLEHPGWRADGLVQLVRQLPLLYQSLARKHDGPVVTHFMPALFDGDPRWTFPSQDELEARDMEQLAAWLGPHLATGPLEVSFVGDLDVEETIGLAARTFGRLPARRERRPYTERLVAPAPRSDVHQVHAIRTEDKKSLVLLAFPLPDGIDPERRRTLEFLRRVVDDRLRLEVRERLGAAYSPGAGLQASQTLPGVGLLFVQALSEPERVETLVEACTSVTDALARDGVTREEVDRLREPILTSIRDAWRSNGFWLSVLSGSGRDPASLGDVRTTEAFFEALGPEPLSKLAATWLPRERASSLVVHPEGTGAAAEPSSASPEPAPGPAADEER